MTFWTYRDIQYSLKQEVGSSDWKWTVDNGEGGYLTGVSSSKEAALERAFQMIDLMPGMPRLENPRRLRIALFDPSQISRRKFRYCRQSSDLGSAVAGD